MLGGGAELFGHGRGAKSARAVALALAGVCRLCHLGRASRAVDCREAAALKKPGAGVPPQQTEGFYMLDKIEGSISAASPLLAAETSGRPGRRLDESRAGFPSVARPASSFVCCPTCGATVERSAPIVDLNQNEISWRGGTARLSPKRAEFAAALVQDFGRFVSVNTIIARVYGPTGEPKWASTAATKEVSRMRLALQSIGLKTEARPGVGIRMFPL